MHTTARDLLHSMPILFPSERELLRPPWTPRRTNPERKVRKSSMYTDYIHRLTKSTDFNPAISSKVATIQVQIRARRPNSICTIVGHYPPRLEKLNRLGVRFRSKLDRRIA